MGKPFVVVVAETQKCSKAECAGKLVWTGRQTLAANPGFSLRCTACGAIHDYVQDKMETSQVRLQAVYTMKNP